MENKSAFIKFLSTYLRDQKIEVTNCPGDADPIVVETAIRIARECKEGDNPVIVAADDTDIAVMSVYHWHTELSDICTSFKKVTTKHRAQGIYLQSIFLHAFPGYETTSAIFNKGAEKIV